LSNIDVLKSNGLTAHAVVIDFVYRNIQPMKDRVYPAFLYVGMNDPTREVTEEMTEDDVKFRVEMILKGEAHNEGSP
ncbi:hypothetical protein, partial [Klebsiella pneumoniae]|uniref:hypothetical protein n=1 Tax=Klebsiella pneumoniae TaxID=573 RepID=UPI0024DEEE08